MRDDLHVTTVLIVDDHESFRTAARRMLERDGFEVVGEAVDGASGIALARAARPDLVLLDVVLPGLSGFDVADRLSGGPAKIVLVSSRTRGDFGFRLRRSPVAGFISKDEFRRADQRAVRGSRVRALFLALVPVTKTPIATYDAAAPE
jgi:DNA-binding NarL/FixJ family response regulator